MHLATFIYTYAKASKKYIYNNIHIAISELVTLVRLKKKVQIRAREMWCGRR